MNIKNVIRTPPTREIELKPIDYQSRRWKLLRQQVMKEENYICRSCKKEGIITKASVCDHIIPVKREPELAWTRFNLQALCKKCHDTKSAKEKN